MQILKFTRNFFIILSIYLTIDVIFFYLLPNDLKTKLYNNRAHQPANIGALKAWAAGGAEFNWSPGIIGHSAFSESQTFLAKTHTPFGTGYRVYEYDRYK